MENNHHLCIHCHFYQPPRENPWIEAIELQESAFPYHDWNERISAECYGPNGQARILDESGRVARLTNNYSRISFNFGPTLLSWMEDHDQQAYQSILDGDKLALQRFGGHGAAIAQAYNHMIMPLANRRDKETQVIWGLRDFEKRFGRQAEAMWLPETAVDTETLEVLAAHGMKYVILAPRQAKATRRLDGDAPWEELQPEEINPRLPYKINLPGGKEIAAFFYDGWISKAVAFEGLLHNGEHFAEYLLDGYDEEDQLPQLLHIATDGESYGHHHRHGEMALAYALEHIEKNSLAVLDNYGYFLEKFPPEYEAQIHDNSSWSCVHGVERWRSDCGCNSGGHGGWNQQWRGPLREAMNFLTEKLTPPYEEFFKALGHDPWQVRNDYIDLVMDRSPGNREKFLAGIKSDQQTHEKILKALEMQRHLLFTYTSCGWFFDEISGLEAVQTLQYAARAIQLAREIFAIDLGGDFKKHLEKAIPNITDLKNGAEVYERFALSACVDLLKITAHFAAMSLFAEQSLSALYSYQFEIHKSYEESSGKARATSARLTVSSQVTGEKADMEYCIIHIGDHNLNVGVRPCAEDREFVAMKNDILNSFSRGDLAKPIRLLDDYFGGHVYSLTDLFKDEQKRIIDIVLAQTLESLEEQFAYIYREHYPVMCFLADSGLTLPPAFSNIAGYIENSRILKGLREEEIDIAGIRASAREARDWHIHFEEDKIKKSYRDALRAYLKRCVDNPEELGYLQEFNDLLALKNDLPFEISLGALQNSYLIWIHKMWHEPAAARPEWRDLATHISDQLNVRIAA